MYHRSLAELICVTLQRCTEELYQVHIYLLLEVLTIAPNSRSLAVLLCFNDRIYRGSCQHNSAITSAYVTQMIVSEYFAF